MSVTNPKNTLSEEGAFYRYDNEQNHISTRKRDIISTIKKDGVPLGALKGVKLIARRRVKLVNFNRVRRFFKNATTCALFVSGVP